MKVAIVGAGYSGLSLALNLHGQIRQALDILLFQAGRDFGPGTAYSTPYPYHLLNVPAKGMSAFASRPDDFVNWLLAHRPGLSCCKLIAWLIWDDPSMIW